MQEIAKKLKNCEEFCCEETVRARQARIDELSMHQKRNPTTVSRLLTQIQDLQNKVNSLSDAREFHDHETASSSGATHVPRRPSTIPSPRSIALPRFWMTVCHAEYYGYVRKRFRTTSCSRRTNLHNLRQFKEFGRSFSTIGT